MIPFINHCRKIYAKFKEDEMSVYAAQASFFIVIAVFPFIMLLLNLIQFIPALNKANLMSIMVDLMPDVIDPLVVSIIDDLYAKSSGTILSITAITALWSASKGMMGVERGLDKIYDSHESRNYIMGRLICSGYTIIFILVFIFSLTLLVFGNSLQLFLQNHFPVIAKLAGYIISVRALLSISILVLFFAGLYKFIPRRKVSIKSQLPGAIFSTFCWMAFSFGFSIYFDYYSNYSYMYGSLTAMVLLMLWLYFCMCILFMGAIVNWYLENID